METTKLPPSTPLRPRGRSGDDAPDDPHHNGGTAPTAVHGTAGDGANVQADSPHGDWGEIHRPRRRSLVIVTIVAVVLLAVLLAVGLIPRLHQSHEVAAEAAAALNAPVMVNVVRPQPADKTFAITVPGTLRPWQEVSVFARTTGYLRKWYADISSQVKAGDLLAEIDAPEVDAQLRAAQAALQQMKAALARAESDLQIARVTNERYLALAGTSGVTQQDLDLKQADFNAAVANRESAKANVAAAEANVKRLSDLQSYEKVYAPFGGVITSRPYDTGSLILADPTATDVKPMYKIAANDVLRAFVNVPQSSALSIRKGMDTKVNAKELPSRTFAGKVMGTTNYLDLNDRTLLTEVKVPNDEHALLPGMYVNVGFTVERLESPLLISAPAIIQSSDGIQVAVVRDGKAHFQKIELGRDFGTTVEVLSGLRPDDQVIGNPGERIGEGVAVKAIENPASPPPAGK